MVKDRQKLGGVGWQWQVANAAMSEARFGGDCIRLNPTARGKNGVKRSLLVEGDGGPLAVVVAPANVHDAKLLEAALEAIVMERPTVAEDSPQKLSLDNGHDNRHVGKRRPNIVVSLTFGVLARRSWIVVDTRNILHAAGSWSIYWVG